MSDVTRAEPVGSLLRPAELLEARREREAGRLGPAEFKRIEDAAVDRAIALQETVGLDVVTDGELRRAHFTGSLSEAVEGLADVPAERIDWHGSAPDKEMTYAHRRAVTGKLRRARSLAQEEFVYLRARAAKPREQLGLCTQCGFSSAIGTYPLDEAQQERKLRLVAEVAARAWPHQARDIP